MMKKTGKLFVSMASLGMALNNVAYAATEVTTESEGGSTTKYLFMGVAALVIVLLLFLGYKMDTKGDDKPVKKVSNKSEKVKKKISEKAEAIKENSGNYEADEEAYEEDGEIFDNEDLNDSVEYKEDDEGSLFAASEDDDEIASEVASEPVKKAEKSSEEFDTSVIDGLDDEEETTPKASFDETMLFNSDEFSATGSSLEDEIDNLDNFETPSTVEIGNTEVEPEEKDVVEATEIEAGESNDFVNELKSFEEPESAFEGFSVAPKKEERLEDIIEEKNKGAKNTEETELEEVAEPEEIIEKTPAFMDNDFLSQMEANLKKSHNDRVAKKETKTTTKKTTKKKEG